MPEAEQSPGGYRIALDIAVLSTEVKNIRGDLDEIKELLKAVASKYVTGEELDDKLDPIRKIVYGMTGTILLSFIGCVVALVWKSAS